MTRQRFSGHLLLYSTHASAVQSKFRIASHCQQHQRSTVCVPAVSDGRYSKRYCDRDELTAGLPSWCRRQECDLRVDWTTGLTSTFESNSLNAFSKRTTILQPSSALAVRRHSLSTRFVSLHDNFQVSYRQLQGNKRQREDIFSVILSVLFFWYGTLLLAFSSFLYFCVIFCCNLEWR